MLAIVLGSGHRRTISLLSQCGWQVATAADSCAEQMNEILKSTADSFVCIIPARMHSSAALTINLPLIHKLEEIITLLSQNRTGVLYSWSKAGDSLFHVLPLIWNRRNVLSQGWTSGFTGKILLPFQYLVMLDKYAQLTQAPDSSWAILQQQGNTLTYKEYVEAPAPPASLQHTLAQGMRAAEIQRLLPLVVAQAAPRLNKEPESAPAPQFSIVLCTYNDGHFVPWALRSVLIQTFTDWEVLLMDDGSHPPLDISQLTPLFQDSRIRLIRSGSNEGKAVRLNEALSLARGKWLLELDADDWLAPDCLERLLQLANSCPSAQLLHGDHELWTASPRRGIRYSRRIAAAPASADWRSLAEEGHPLVPRCYRTDTLRALGGWWTHAPLEGRKYEDIQMAARLLQNDPQAAVSVGGDPLYHRRLRSDSISQYSKEPYLHWKQWLIHTLETNGPA